MATIMYGTKNCPDVRATLAYIAEKGLDIEFKDFDISVKNLKEFILLRDRRPEFDMKKANGFVGIPCFRTEDDKIVFDIRDI